MRSLTKRWLSRAEIEDLLRHGIGPDAALRDQVELTDGAFNAVYALTLADGRELVLKVAPDPALKLMRYEVDLMHIEIEYYRRAATVGVPLPGFRAGDPDRGYLLVDRLRGQPLETAKRTMTPAQLAEVRRALGATCARLRTLTSPWFGYPRRDGHTRAASWRESFLTILEDVLTDAREYGRELPAPVATVRRTLHRHADLLDEVRTASFVHFDLWDGNVFVLPDGDGYFIEGLIDGERGFYGDPIAELASLALFTEPEELTGLLPGFLGRPLTERERGRLRLYRVYLYLIMVTEGATRGFDPAEHEPVRRHTLNLLEKELSHL